MTEKLKTGQVNLDSARNFLELLHGTEVPVVTWQTFDDAKDRKLSSLIYGAQRTLADAEDHLAELNRQGAGVYTTLCRMRKGKPRSNKAAEVSLAVGADLDAVELPDAFPLPPSIIVESSPGRHWVIWLIEPTADLDAWKACQKRVAKFYGGDPAVCDPARVCRVPGFYHNKSEPFLSRILSAVELDSARVGDFSRYTLADIEDAHPVLSETLSSSGTGVGGKNPTEPASWDEPRNIEAAKAYLARLDPSDYESFGDAELYKAVCGVRDYAMSESVAADLLDVFNERAASPWSDDDLAEKITNAYRYASGRAGSKAFVDPIETFANAPSIAADETEFTPQPKAPAVIIRPTPYSGRAGKDIDPRDWLYGRYYIRRFLTMTAASSGVGKSRLIMGEAVAMASLQPFLGHSIYSEAPLRQWYYNGEDPLDELDRGFAAINQQFNIDPNDYKANLFVDSGRTLPIKIATMEDGKGTIIEPVVKQVIEAIKDFKIDVLHLDPFITTHNVTENDTMAIEMVARQWWKISDECNCSIGISHHNRKTGGIAGTIEDSRGAGALIATVRVKRAVNKMTDAEARAAGIQPEKRGFFYSVNDATSNLSPPAKSLDWYELKSVDLGNQRGLLRPADRLGVAVPFTYTKANRVPEVTMELETKAFDAIRQKPQWRFDAQSDDWIGHAFSVVVGLGSLHGLKEGGKRHYTPEQTLARRKASALITHWLDTHALTLVEGKDAKNKPRTYVRATIP